MIKSKMNPQKEPLQTVFIDIADGTVKYLHMCQHNIIAPAWVNTRPSGTKVAKCERCRKLFVDNKTLHEFRDKHRGRKANVKMNYDRAPRR